MAAGSIYRSPLFLALRVIVCVIILDYSIFFFLPLSFLYPASFQESPAKMQIAAILFNDFNATFTGINNETKRRVNHGITLLKNKRVDQLIMVGGNRNKSGRKGSQFMADYAFKEGVLAEKILIEDSSNDSISNLVQLGRILQEKKIGAVALVSSPFHLLRIKKLSSGMEAIYIPYDPTSCSPSLTRGEVWFSAHYNTLAYIAHKILPESFYKISVMWIRENTEW